MATRGQLQCELPNANLHHFQGRFKFVADEGECEAASLWRQASLPNI